MIAGAKVYVYKLTVEDGGAPCVADNLLSLAICKPIIRQVAEKGSWIFGFAANSLGTHPDNRLIYVARVDEIIAPSAYYVASSPYRNRPDCIYEWSGRRFKIRADAAYHSDGTALEHDLGTADGDTNRGRVILSDFYKYFGTAGPVPSLDPNDPLRMFLAQLGQGHRVNLGPDLLASLDELAIQAFSRNGLASSPAGGGLDCVSNRCDSGLGSNDPAISLIHSSAC